jgi:hypothetical protein
MPITFIAYASSESDGIGESSPEHALTLAAENTESENLTMGYEFGE